MPSLKCRQQAQAPLPHLCMCVVTCVSFPYIYVRFSIIIGTLHSRTSAVRNRVFIFAYYCIHYCCFHILISICVHTNFALCTSLASPLRKCVLIKPKQMRYTLFHSVVLFENVHLWQQRKAGKRSVREK